MYRSLLNILCLLALCLFVRAGEIAQPVEAPPVPGQLQEPAQVQQAAQVPLKPEVAPPVEPGAAPVEGAEAGAVGAPKAPEPPRENIVDHIAKACPGLQPDVEVLRDEIAHPNQFCRYFLSQRRTRSPMVHMNADTVMKACVCLLRQEGMGITSSSNGPAPSFIPAAETVNDPESLRCNSKYEDLIMAEYNEYRHFCKYYGTRCVTSFSKTSWSCFYKLLTDHSLRRISPIPGLSAVQVTEGCKCILENSAKTPVRTSARNLRTATPVADAAHAAVTTATIIMKTVIVNTGS
ncbi:hypothetical protein ANO11243_005280 [Dothideomycetidae sp. 11243]|nr:hypothetical protein ANO11243_005280 [fungal sp. No.11243]